MVMAMVLELRLAREERRGAKTSREEGSGNKEPRYGDETETPCRVCPNPNPRGRQQPPCIHPWPWCGWRDADMAGWVKISGPVLPRLISCSACGIQGQ
jgi:hypothetical protein